jgi:hypothetical protein
MQMCGAHEANVWSDEANVRSLRCKCAELTRQMCGAIGQMLGAISEHVFGCWMCRSGRVIDRSTAVIIRLQESITDQILEHSGDIE